MLLSNTIHTPISGSTDHSFVLENPSVLLDSQLEFFSRLRRIGKKGGNGDMGRIEEDLLSHLHSMQKSPDLVRPLFRAPVLRCLKT